jgi:capsular polysaccharide biosynthesis protein
LYQPSPPGLLEHYPRWVVDYHRHEVGLPSQPRTRRLYVHRRHHRRNAVNEAEVSACLRAAGFEAFESTDPTSDRQAFAQASAVVGLHGAGLAMIACCLPGTSVLEIAPANHLLPHYRSLALEGGLDYGLLIGRPVSNQTSPPWAPPTDVDFHLPIPDLVGMLRIMGFTSTSE